MAERETDETRSLSRWLANIGPAEAFETLSRLMPEAAVFAVDADRNVLLWSDGAERLLGFRAEEAVGGHCLKSQRCSRCMGQCGIAVHGSVRGVPLTMYRADGSRVRVRKTGRAFFDDDGEFAGGIEVLLPDRGEPDEDPRPSRTLEATEFHGLVSRDPSMLQVFRTIANVAETDATVLVRGESGSGKELVARAVHEESLRAKGPFVPVSCAALTPTLLESELFGHVKGAFTGAVRDRGGLFQEATGGTLFLDEVAELPIDLQAKLLRVLEERVVVPVGSERRIPVDVRLISATHRALRQEVREGRFREDLLFRLRIVPLFIPPLRERRSDVELLLWHFIERFNAAGPRRIESIAPEAMRVLIDHDWPGNVRELRNVVEYAFAVGRGVEMRLEELPPEFRGAVAPDERDLRPIGRPRDEKDRILEALRITDGNVGEAAAVLGLSRATFWRKRKKHGI